MQHRTIWCLNIDKNNHLILNSCSFPRFTAVIVIKMWFCVIYASFDRIPLPGSKFYCLRNLFWMSALSPSTYRFQKWKINLKCCNSWTLSVFEYVNFVIIMCSGYVDGKPCRLIHHVLSMSFFVFFFQIHCSFRFFEFGFINGNFEFVFQVIIVSLLLINMRWTCIAYEIACALPRTLKSK